MKITEEKLDKLAEMIKNNLRERLGREPTEKELVNALPAFICTHIEEGPTKR